MTARRAAGPLLVILLSSVALGLLDASGQAFWQGLVINLGLFIILTVSLNLTSGFTGVFSLGQIGFMALGAYASAILTLPLQEKAAYLPELPSWIAGTSMRWVCRQSPISCGTCRSSYTRCRGHSWATELSSRIYAGSGSTRRWCSSTDGAPLRRQVR